jgi:DNA replication initiation complex subunit (GINS family)
MTDRYNRLLDAWRREKHDHTLQPLPESFATEMSGYASKLREQTRMVDRGSMRGKIAVKEKENAENMLQDLFQIRLRKIFASEIDNVPIPATNLTPDEKRLQADFRHLLSRHSDRIKGLLTGRSPLTEEPIQQRRGFKIVRFVEALPAIIGIDMKTYGPFNPEDVALIPTENAENLIRRGIAKEVETSR